MLKNIRDIGLTNDLCMWTKTGFLFLIQISKNLLHKPLNLIPFFHSHPLRLFYSHAYLSAPTMSRSVMNLCGNITLIPVSIHQPRPGTASCLRTQQSVLLFIQQHNCWFINIASFHCYIQISSPSTNTLHSHLY